MARFRLSIPIGRTGTVAEFEYYADRADDLPESIREDIASAGLSVPPNHYQFVTELSVGEEVSDTEPEVEGGPGVSEEDSE